MILPTCKHPVAYIEHVYHLTVGEYTTNEEGVVPCITYRSYCPECYEEALQDKFYPVLFTAEDEWNWLQGTHPLQASTI